MSVNLVVFTGPSGAGKTELAVAIVARTSVKRVITCTTRAPRAGEVDGRDYRFFSQENFLERLSRGEFAEHATVHKNFYGTLREDIDIQINSGSVSMLVMDIQGAETIARMYPAAQIFFIFAPYCDLVRRLNDRKMSDKLRAERIEELEKELAGSKKPFISRVIDNEDGNFEKAFRKIRDVIVSQVGKPI